MVLASFLGQWNAMFSTSEVLCNESNFDYGSDDGYDSDDSDDSDDDVSPQTHQTRVEDTSRHTRQATNSDEPKKTLPSKNQIVLEAARLALDAYETERKNEQEHKSGMNALNVQKKKLEETHSKNQKQNRLSKAIMLKEKTERVFINKFLRQ